VLAELPRGPTGKLDRRALTERLGAAGAEQVGPAEPAAYHEPRRAQEPTG